MERSNYRADIDGLRAIAVLVVVFYHVGISAFQGGFVGVDVFFVISGFLITQLIRAEVRAHRFTFGNFYLRRARRLFPALYCTLSLSLVGAFLLFSPEHMARFGGALLHAALSVSNFYFWSEAGYFDTASSFKPLLHTWSLSVEEQFYIVWPALFLTLMRKTPTWFVVLFIASVGLAGVVASEQWVKTDAAGAFYLAPARVTEFAIGALMVWLVKYRPRNPLVLEFLCLVGLALIAQAVQRYSENTLFPALHVLQPCLGTALVIYAGTARHVGKVLRNRIVVGIGLISYSLYLVHWPIVVFYKYYKFDDLVRSEKIGIVLVALACATLMYRYVETPFRNSDPRRTRFSPPAFGLACSLLILIIVFPAAQTWATGGWAWRMSTTSPPAELVHELRVTTLESHVQAREALGGKYARIWSVGSESPAAKKGLLIGDSHALHLVYLADYLGRKYQINFTVFAGVGCPAVFETTKVFRNAKAIGLSDEQEKACAKIGRAWQQQVQSTSYDVVMLASRWAWLYEPSAYGKYNIESAYLVTNENPKYSVEDSRATLVRYLEQTVRSIRDSGAEVVVFAQVPHQGANPEGCDNAPRYLFGATGMTARCHPIEKSRALERLKFTDQFIATLSQIDGVDVVIPSRYFCDNDDDHCRLFESETRLYSNNNHLNQYGAMYLARRWEADSDFPF